MGMGPKKRTASIDISPWPPPAKKALQSGEQLGAKLKYSLSELEHHMVFDEESMSNESSETEGR